jgi:uncharacterized protein YbbC (DUF1343 family)
LLLASPDLRLERLFAPEHGLWGHEQDMESVPDSTDRRTGLPVVSLYGHDARSLSPSPEDLQDLDLLVCDLQDVGSRYYTYVYTLSFLMEAAREADLPVVVLDRPNPIGGELVEGPVLEHELASFVGRYPIPVRHGLTIGELALLFNAEIGIGCELEVVQLLGWRRSMEFAETGLPWVPPSPNMPTPQTARVYPGGCLVEGTNLSEGRGTTTPFELIGAPWIDGHEYRAAIELSAPRGVRFRAASFRPMFQKHAGHSCGGVQVIVDHPSSFRPFACFWDLIARAKSLDPERFGWRDEAYEFEADRPAIDLLLGRGGLRELLDQGTPHAEAESHWREGLQEFIASRGRYLLYT